MDKRGKTSLLVSMLLLGVMLFAIVVTISASEPNNLFGVHMGVRNFMADSVIEQHMKWAAALLGKGGYVKDVMYPLAPYMEGPLPSWVKFTQSAYDNNLIPILRLGPNWANGAWEKPVKVGKTYSLSVDSIKAVANGLPIKEATPLYLQLWNAPNNKDEWGGVVEPTEYAKFFVEVYDAIKSLGKPEIKLLYGCLAPKGDMDPLEFLSVAFKAVPKLADCINEIGIWNASAAVANIPPEYNHENGNVVEKGYALDWYREELKVLAEYGVDIDNLKILITLDGWKVGERNRLFEEFPTVTQDLRAEYMVSAFTEYFAKWTEVLAVTPWQLAEVPEGDVNNWIPNFAVDENGYPSETRTVYRAIAELDKPTD